MQLSFSIYLQNKINTLKEEKLHLIYESRIEADYRLAV